MTEQIAKDDAAKRRIVTHLNEDHHDSLVRYLEHYCKLPAWKAHNGTMTDVTLDSMHFECGGKTYEIPLKPPMSSYRDARERAVQMDKESLQGLGRSDITVKEFVPPTGLYALEFIIIASTFLAYSQRWWFGRGEVVERVLGSGFARFSYSIQPYLISAMASTHAAELVYFIRNKLSRHSVNPRTCAWWLWVGFTFIEGQFAFKRFDDQVSKKRDEKEKQKH